MNFFKCLLVFLLQVGLTFTQDICDRCECLPVGQSPTQAICRDTGSPDPDKTFLPVTSAASKSLELVYVYGIETVNFEKGSFVTDKPVTLLIQNCSTVNVLDEAVVRLRTLIIRDAERVTVGVLPRDELWTTVLENIQELTVASSALSANYSVTIGHIGSLTLQPLNSGYACIGNPEFTFTLFDSKVKPVLRSGLSLCGGHITIHGSTFASVEEEGLQVTAEGSITVVNNRFDRVVKQAFNLSAPEIHIRNNHFETLPAGALRGVSTLLDTFFTNNTVLDIDLGGVLLDMGWDMIVEHNTIDCDCASKRTSILNPKHDMLYLTNTSHDKLNNIFLNNFCNLNCTVSLRAFSYALVRGEVCATNNTELAQESLCQFTLVPDTTTLSSSDNTTSFVFSAASRVEFLVPLTIIVISVLITSSVCYGCKEMNTFKFKFNPNRQSSSKASL